MRSLSENIQALERPEGSPQRSFRHRIFSVHKMFSELRHKEEAGKSFGVTPVSSRSLSRLRKNVQDGGKQKGEYFCGGIAPFSDSV